MLNYSFVFKQKLIDLLFLFPSNHEKEREGEREGEREREREREIKGDAKERACKTGSA